MISFSENKRSVDGFLTVSFTFIEFLNRLKNSVKPEKTAFLCKCLFSSFLMAHVVIFASQIGITTPIMANMAVIRYVIHLHRRHSGEGLGD